MGFTVISMWEHEFNRMCKNDEEVRQIVSNIPDFEEPLEPRDAFLGERTETFTQAYSKYGAIRYSATEMSESDRENRVLSEYSRLEYVDFTSLYPDVQKNQIFPIGHLTVITDSFDMMLESYFGLAKSRCYLPEVSCSQFSLSAVEEN